MKARECAITHLLPKTPQPEMGGLQREEKRNKMTITKVVVNVQPDVYSSSLELKKEWATTWSIMEALLIAEEKAVYGQCTVDYMMFATQALDVLGTKSHSSQNFGDWKFWYYFLNRLCAHQKVSTQRHFLAKLTKKWKAELDRELSYSFMHSRNFSKEEDLSTLAFGSKVDAGLTFPFEVIGAHLEKIEERMKEVYPRPQIRFYDESGEQVFFEFEED